MIEQDVDWSKCEDVESVPGRLSGAWVIKGTRVPAQAVVDNARAGCTAEEIATEIFELPLERVKGVLRFAKIGTPSKEPVNLSRPRLVKCRRQRESWDRLGGLRSATVAILDAR